jgi:hypothetical protein
MLKSQHIQTCPYSSTMFSQFTAWNEIPALREYRKSWDYLVYWWYLWTMTATVQHFKLKQLHVEIFLVSVLTKDFTILYFTPAMKVLHVINSQTWWIYKSKIKSNMKLNQLLWLGW